MRESIKKALSAAGLIISGLLVVGGGVAAAESGAVADPAAEVSAQALPGGPWGTLTVYTDSGIPIAQASGTWQGYREDQNRGSRMQDWMQYRDPANSDSNGAYVDHDWYFNSNQCYVSSYSTSGGGIACSQGWWGAGSYDSMDRAGDSNWKYWEAWRAIDPTGTSGRGAMRACVDFSWATDPCSAAILRGNVNY
ncbi:MULTISPECIES: hypothetical protein [Saccharothrix]|uniref:hypothetical protein n=1 Tax=Saccharothrix TaxID=2071 RepID=UPI00093C5F57|nr:hypothetical protein [Saccharothrix sp. CB00851]OKI18663.1 hypothetical protein A6A25_39635 [Saccharothrix sp. CB00851]